jgi:hypothetical protein
MTAADQCPTCQRLLDLEAIKQVKARYFRHMDNHDWVAFAEVFASDAVAGSGEQKVVGRSAIVDYIAAASAGSRSAHQGLLPEIELLGDGRARGVWAMSDYFEVLDTDPPVGFTGYGHYHDEYVFEDGAWRIAASRLTRLKIVPFAGGVPDFYKH